MFSSLSSTTALKALYAGNALWFTSAFIHFSFKQKGVMRKLSTRKNSIDPGLRKLAEGDGWHHDIMSYLGSINTSLAFLACIRIYALIRPSKFLSTGSIEGDTSLDVTALLVLGLGNFSQAFVNFWLGYHTERWIMGKGFDRITVLDALLTVLDWAAAIGKMSVGAA